MEDEEEGQEEEGEEEKGDKGEGRRRRLLAFFAGGVPRLWAAS